MTEIEKKALELVNEIHIERNDCAFDSPFDRKKHCYDEALCRAIEEHEAFRQEVSDAAEHLCRFYGVPIVVGQLEHFIIAKPDPLVDAMAECGVDPFESWADRLRAALAKRGLEIVEKK